MCLMYPSTCLAHALYEGRGRGRKDTRDMAASAKCHLANTVLNRDRIETVLSAVVRKKRLICLRYTKRCVEQRLDVWCRPRYDGCLHQRAWLGIDLHRPCDQCKYAA